MNKDEKQYYYYYLGFFFYYQLEYYKSVVFYGFEVIGKIYLVYRMVYFVVVSILNFVIKIVKWSCKCWFYIVEDVFRIYSCYIYYF